MHSSLCREHPRAVIQLKRLKKPSFVLSGFLRMCLILKSLAIFICKKYVWMLGCDFVLWIQETGKSNIWTLEDSKLSWISGTHLKNFSTITPVYEGLNFTLSRLNWFCFYCAQPSRMTFSIKSLIWLESGKIKQRNTLKTKQKYLKVKRLLSREW